ncbi:hypothetical protein LY76DRAFT_492076, partial [Colletotrichum caudatum]
MAVQLFPRTQSSTMSSAMYGKLKTKDSVLDLCTRATLLGNHISVRMLEFLTTVKHHPHGFRSLASEFLDICRILWSIEAGLLEAARAEQEFPADMIKELELKFRQTNNDFQSLDHMMFEFLEYERKGTVGKFQRGWRMMFVDKEMNKMRDSIRKAKEALRMSALVFQWSMGDAKTDAAAGEGYASLAAALDRIGVQTSTVRVTRAKSFEAQSAPPPRLSDPPTIPLPPIPKTHSPAPHSATPSVIDKISADL